MLFTVGVVGSPVTSDEYELRPGKTDGLLGGDIILLCGSLFDELFDALLMLELLKFELLKKIVQWPAEVGCKSVGRSVC